MREKRKFAKLLGTLGMAFALSAGLAQFTPLIAKASGYEAKIGENYYSTMEEAFQNVKPGETIIALENCSVNTTLIVNGENITLKSEDPENPVTVERDEAMLQNGQFEFAYMSLIAVESGSFTTEDIILDGGSASDRNYESPLVYSKGTYYMKDGTILRNNNNDNGQEEYQSLSAGGVSIREGTFVMSGGVIENCYTNGFGGGIQVARDAGVSITGGSIKDCGASMGGGIYLVGPGEISGLTVSDCYADINGGGLYISGNYEVTLDGCTVTGNHAQRGAALIVDGSQTSSKLLTVRNCTVTNNRTTSLSSGAIDYRHYGGLLLDGSTTFAGNVSAGEAYDISLFRQEAEPVILGESFESSSIFVLGRSNEIVPVKKLVDGSTYGKPASLEQFTWNNASDYITLKDGDIYLDEEPETGGDTSDKDNDTDDNTDTGTGSDTDTDSGTDMDTDADADIGSDEGTDTDMDTDTGNNSDSDMDTGSDAFQEIPPVIQTGKTSPVPFFAALYVCGMLLVCLAFYKGKE